MNAPWEPKPAVNELHETLRNLGIEAAIEFVRGEIVVRGHDVVKADPGVEAWVMENRAALESRSKFGGLS